MRASPIIYRLPLLILLIATGAAAAVAQVGGSQRDEDAKVFDGLRQPQTPPIPSWVPESERADYLAIFEISRELQNLQPLFTRLGLDILQEIKELEQRPEGSLGQWAEALRRRYTSPPGLVATAIIIERIDGRDGLEGLSAEEREIRLGGVQRRLVRLAITGRITKEEFERLVKRLQGN